MSHLHGTPDDLDMEPGVTIAPPNESDEDVELDSPNWLPEDAQALQERGFVRINDPRKRIAPPNDSGELREVIANALHDLKAQTIKEFLGAARWGVNGNVALDAVVTERWRWLTRNTYSELPYREQEIYRREVDAILELISGGIDLGSSILIPKGSDPLAMASLLERALPEDSWKALVVAILGMRMSKW